MLECLEGFHTTQGCFNPHPALLPGDAVSVSAPVITSNGFNPHPALLPGDAEPPAVADDLIIAFQSAPGIAAG